jgi:hypothetical protein
MVIRRGDPLTQHKSAAELRQLAENYRASQAFRFDADFLRVPDESLTQTRSALSGLLNALSNLSTATNTDNQNQTEAHKWARRAAMASEIDQTVASIRNATVAFHVAGSALLKQLGSTVRGTKLAQSLSNFMFIFSGQMTSMLSELTALRDTISNGGPLPLSPDVMVTESEPISKTRAMFSLDYLKWREAGETKLAHQFTKVDLPIALIDTAMAYQLVDECGSERAQKLMAVEKEPLPTLTADDKRLVDLDALGNDRATHART